MVVYSARIRTCKDDSRHLLGGHVGEVLEDLDGAHLMVQTRLVLLAGLADAQHGAQALVQHLAHLSIDRSVIVAEQCAISQGKKEEDKPAFINNIVNQLNLYTTSHKTASHDTYRRSEWPHSTYLAPTSLSMHVLTAPV